MKHKKSHCVNQSGNIVFINEIKFMTLRYLITSCFILIQVLWYSGESKAQDVAFEMDKQFENVKQLTIDGDFCSVKINGSDSGVTSLKGVIKSNENKEAYKINSDLQDGNLTVQVIKPESWKSHWGELEFVVPNGVALDIKTQSGRVTIMALQNSSVNIDSKSGHVVIDDVNIKLHSVSPAGDINLKNVKGSFRASTKSGTVIVSGADGDFTLSSSKGNYLIKDLKGSLLTEGGTGNQELENVEGDINLKTTSGELNLSLCKGNIITRTFEGSQKIFQTEGIYKLQTSTGTITGNRVVVNASSSFETTEGNIKIQVAPKQNLAYELKSENSFLRAMNKSKKKSLKVGKSDIVVTGISTTGSQAYY